MSWIKNLIKSILRALLVLILFVLLSPGFVITIPGNNNVIDFISYTTSLLAIIIHSIIFTITFFSIDYLVSTLIFPLF